MINNDGDVINHCFVYIVFPMVMSFCIFHLIDETRCPKTYVCCMVRPKTGYGGFCLFQIMFNACMYALNVVGFGLDLFRQHVIAHLDR